MKLHPSLSIENKSLHSLILINAGKYIVISLIAAVSRIFDSFFVIGIKFGIHLEINLS
jgi:hypothetical protein